MATMRVIPYSERHAVFTIRRADGHTLVLGADNRLIHLNPNGDVVQDFGQVSSVPDYLVLAYDFIDQENGL